MYLKAVLRLRNETFTPELSDLLSNRSRALASVLEGKIMRIYKGVPDVRDVNVVAFRCVCALAISKIISLFNSEIEILALIFIHIMLRCVRPSVRTVKDFLKSKRLLWLIECVCQKWALSG